MPKLAEHQKALDLRAKGMSYNQIRAAVGVSKSTLSYWLRAMPLSPERMRELRDNSTRRIEHFRETMRAKREKRLRGLYKEQKKYLLPMRKKEVFIAGLFLYWGEGAKTKTAELAISNTDPAVIIFFMEWLIVCFGISKDKFHVRLQLYSDMDANHEMRYWMGQLNLPRKQFRKSYIKKSTQNQITYKRRFHHGTCNLHYCNARIAEKVFMAMAVMADYYIRPKPKRKNTNINGRVA